MKFKFTLLLLLAVSILAACVDKNEVKDSPLYDGKPLTIGVVGNAPEVREENIQFKEIDLEEINLKNLSSAYDSVFIMKEHLSEAATAPYAKVYKTANIPFFFIESEKSYVPFIYEDINYEDYPDSKSGLYADGYFQSGEQGQYWGFGVYNDTINETNILDVYSRIFETIETVANES